MNSDRKEYDMNRSLITWKKRLAVLALGGATYALAGSQSGCKNTVLSDFLVGAGNGAIVAATDAAFAGLPDNVEPFVVDSVTSGLQSAWDQIVNYRFPVIVVQNALFVQ